jgi:hypothetical protein
MIFGIKEKPKMKKGLIVLFGVAAICLFVAAASNVIAADVNQPKTTPKETPKESPKDKSKDNNLVIGIVTIVKDNDGNITEVKVTAHKDLVYRVVLDEKGLDLGKTMVDRRARIEGTIETKGDVQWVTVKTFGEVKAGAPAKSKANPKAKPAKPAKPAPKSPPKQQQ